MSGNNNLLELGSNFRISNHKDIVVDAEKRSDVVLFFVLFRSNPAVDP